MFLTETNNAMIKVTNCALFLRYTTYPPIENENNEENCLKVELRPPNDSSQFYEISVAFIGPWKAYIHSPVLLYNMFMGSENEVLAMQRACEGSFVTIFEYRMEPEPKIYYCAPEYNEELEQWTMDQGNKCRVHDAQPLADVTEFVFKSLGEEVVVDMVAKSYERFLQKTCFMFYDITFEFNYQDNTFERKGINDLLVPWCTAKRLKRFFKHVLGPADSIGTAWISQDEDESALKLFEVTAVCYGKPGDGKYLPVWILGPSGVPIAEFSTTLYTQLICQAAAMPVDLECSYDPPSGLPPPDICLQVPPQHALAKRNHFLVIVLMLPIKEQKFNKHHKLIKTFDSVTAKNWECIVDTIKEVMDNPITTAEEVRNSVDGEEEMEHYLEQYLKYEYFHNRDKKCPLKKVSRSCNLPKGSQETDQVTNEEVNVGPKTKRRRENI